VTSQPSRRNRVHRPFEQLRSSDLSAIPLKAYFDVPVQQFRCLSKFISLSTQVISTKSTGNSQRKQLSTPIATSPQITNGGSSDNYYTPVWLHRSHADLGPRYLRPWHWWALRKLELKTSDGRAQLTLSDTSTSLQSTYGRRFTKVVLHAFIGLGYMEPWMSLNVTAWNGSSENRLDRLIFCW
jgi:hypothetical protein